ncbi:MAG TPA: hypothetical protein VJY62_15475 [Bacteroidia bacterium]|nr:hypothetical protein [Bacteroidia bacterium]
MNAEEQKLLVKAPALVSVLAATKHHKINEVQKAHAIKLAHLHTFSADPDLRSYYDKVDKHFIENFESIARQYAPFDDAQLEALKKEIDKVNQVILSLDSDLSAKLHKSLSEYTEHVKYAEHSVLEHFVFPVPIKGLTE